MGRWKEVKLLSLTCSRTRRAETTKKTQKTFLFLFYCPRLTYKKRNVAIPNDISNLYAAYQSHDVRMRQQVVCDEHIFPIILIWGQILSIIRHYETLNGLFDRSLLKLISVRYFLAVPVRYLRTARFNATRPLNGSVKLPLDTDVAMKSTQLSAHFSC